MANKVLELLIFAFLTIDYAEAASQIYTVPTNVISSPESRRGEITTDYCETKGCTKECSEQGFEWYSCTAFTDDDLCTCASKFIAN